MTTAYHPADALLYEFGLTSTSIYIVRLLAYWVFPASWAYALTSACLISFINDNPWKLAPRGLGERLQLRGLIWRIIPRPAFVTRFYAANPVPTQLICTLAVLGIVQFLRSLALSPLVHPHIRNILDPVPLLVVITGIASVNPNPQRGRASSIGFMWSFLPAPLPWHGYFYTRKRRRERQGQLHLTPFHNDMPLDLQRLIAEESIHDARRNEDMSQIVSLILTCRTYRDWIEPQLYQYVRVDLAWKMKRFALSCGGIPQANGKLALPDKTDIPPGWDRCLKRALSVSAVSLSGLRTTSDALSASLCYTGLVLIRLQRLCIRLSLLVSLESTACLFHAKDVTIIVDSNQRSSSPRDHFSHLTPTQTKIRFTLPLVNSHFSTSEVYGSFDAQFMSWRTLHIAIEIRITSLEAMVILTNAISDMMKLLPEQLGRMVILVWLEPGMEAQWVPPSIAADARGSGLLVPISASKADVWTFDALERRGLDFWEEVERVADATFVNEE